MTSSLINWCSVPCIPIIFPSILNIFLFIKISKQFSIINFVLIFYCMKFLPWNINSFFQNKTSDHFKWTQHERSVISFQEKKKDIHLTHYHLEYHILSGFEPEKVACGRVPTYVKKNVFCKLIPCSISLKIVAVSIHWTFISITMEY